MLASKEPDLGSLDWRHVTDEARERFEESFIDGYAQDMQESGKDPEDAAWQAIVYLLVHGYQPSRRLLKLIAYELKLLLWPDAKERRRYRSLLRTEAERRDLEATIARKRSEGLGEKDAVLQARKEVAHRWLRNSDQALRKALQPSRVNRQSRQEAGPKQRKKRPGR
jgi:hypothetical protein